MAEELDNEQLNSADYSADNIQSLEGMEHVRMRPSMYIGDVSTRGLHHLVYEVLDNSIDEFKMQAGKRIEVDLEAALRVSVRDYGRGIPLGKVVECVSVINTGAKYNDEVFQFSVGLNGVGTKAVNALSEYFRVVSVRDGKYAEAVFERGVLKHEKQRDAKKGIKNGTLVEFIPDREIFGDYTFNLDFIEKRMWNYAYLNAGLTLTFNGASYISENGLLDLLNAEIGEETLYTIAHFKEAKLEFAFTHTNNYGETYREFTAKNDRTLRQTINPGT